MPTTASGIVYPSSTDDVDVPGDLAALAASVETLIAALKNPPTCRIRASASQSIATSAITKVTFDTVDFDTDTMADLTNSQIVVHTAGMYLVTSLIGYNSNATGVRSAYVYAGQPTPLLQASAQVQAVTSSPTIVPIAYQVRCAVGDMIIAQTLQASGAALGTIAANGQPELTVVRVGP